MSSVETLAWRRVLLLDPCAYCGAPSREVDHIVPRTARGQDGPENETGSCLPCNRRKKGKSLLAALSGHAVGYNSEHHRPLAAERANTQRRQERQHRAQQREQSFLAAYQRKYNQLFPA